MQDRGGIRCMTKNTYVVCDNYSQSVLFFSRDGAPKSRFNRNGQGPQDYLEIGWILYDEEADDLFLCNTFSEIDKRYIQVYSSTGEYKRKIAMPYNTELRSFFSFDNKSLFVYASYNPSVLGPGKDRETEIRYTTYYRISKLNGEILDSLKLKSNDVSLVLRIGAVRSLSNYRRLVKGIDGFFLCNPETDTVYYYSGDKSLTPVLHKIPLARNQDPKAVITNVADAGRYLFFSVETIASSTLTPFIYYFLDKETGEIFLQNLTLPDYKGKKITISAYDAKDANYFIIGLDLYELKDAYKEDRLSGKLKELVATLNEDKDNNVYVLINLEK